MIRVFGLWFYGVRNVTELCIYRTYITHILNCGLFIKIFFLKTGFFEKVAKNQLYEFGIGEDWRHHFIL